MAEEDRYNHLDQRLGRLEITHDTLADRVRSLEDWQVQKKIAEAREDERDKTLYERLTRMEDTFQDAVTGLRGEINKIGEFGRRIFWIAATPIITALVIAIAIAIMWEFKFIIPPNLGVKP